MEFDVGHLAHDVVLGMDWSAAFRDSLISAGVPVRDSFDTWAYYSSCFPPLAFRDQLLLRTPPSLRSQSTEQCIIILGSFYSGCRAPGPYIIFKSSD
ncbi:hypothetical protein B0H11DRAFT_2216947 [Mycena galericulata]|nr:hypothetical protein B0H11DRAFT_2216947 [Mycena galericulata]